MLGQTICCHWSYFKKENLIQEMNCALKSLRWLIFPENQTSHLITLPSRSKVFLRRKCTIWCPSRDPTVGFWIVLFNQQSLIRLYIWCIVPLVGWVCLDFPRLWTRLNSEVVSSLGVSKFVTNVCVNSGQILFNCGSSIAECQIVSVHFTERAPKIDDTPANRFEMFRLWMVF